MVLRKPSKKQEVPWNKTKKFLKTQASWYAKLKKKGFEDIEYDEDHLKLSSSRFVVRDKGAYANPMLTTAKYEYYSSCRKFLNDYKFKNKKERQVFEMHSEGISIRDIADKMKLPRRKVHEIIKELTGKIK